MPLLRRSGCVLKLGTDGVRCVGNPRDALEQYYRVCMCTAPHRTSPVLLYGSLSHVIVIGR